MSALVAAMLALAALTVEAQKPAKVHRIGLLAAGAGPSADSFRQSVLDAFRQQLRQLGYIEGKNFTLELRYAEGRFERLPKLAAELVQANVDVIVATSSQTALAAKQATRTIPIVFSGVSDPVGHGLVTNLARPGGNITGNSNIAHELAAKRLELLKEVVADISVVAMLWNPATAFAAPQLRETHRAAQSYGIRLQLFEVREPGAFGSTFEAMAREGAQGLIVVADPLFISHRERLAELALKHRLPSIFTRAENAKAGALMAYGPNILDNYRHAAVYVDKILRGANPGDLPVEGPTKIELVVNAKTAKALGLTIPSALRFRADQIIE